MFEDMVLSGKTKRTNKPWTVALSLAIQALLVGILILIPLIYTEALPKTMMATMLTAPPPPEQRRKHGAPGRPSGTARAR